MGFLLADTDIHNKALMLLVIGGLSLGAGILSFIFDENVTSGYSRFSRFSDPVIHETDREALDRMVLCSTVLGLICMAAGGYGLYYL